MKAVFGTVLNAASTGSDNSMSSKQVGFLSILAALFLADGVSPAYAYLDPGAGSMIVQGIIGAIAGATVVIGIYWGKVAAFFTNRRDAKPEEDGNTDKE